MNYPIDRKTQLVTQIYRGTAHRGVDLRCVDDVTKENLDVVMPETCEIIRQGKDGFGNYYIVARPVRAGRTVELKFIHINKTQYELGKIIRQGDAFARCIVGGNSRSLHLHFETWGDDGPYNPSEYFAEMGIDYRVK